MAGNNTVVGIDFLSTSLSLMKKISSGAKLIAARTHTVFYKEKENKLVAVKRHQQQVFMLILLFCKSVEIIINVFSLVCWTKTCAERYDFDLTSIFSSSFPYCFIFLAETGLLMYTDLHRVRIYPLITIYILFLLNKWKDACKASSGRQLPVPSAPPPPQYPPVGSGGGV